MKPFRFTLQRLLDLRATKMEDEETKLSALQHEFNRLDEKIADLERGRKDLQDTYAKVARTSGQELRAMTDFSTKLSRDQATLTQKRALCAQSLAQQRERYLAVRKECRLLEKLRTKQLSEWVVESNREQEKVASELYLARWDGNQTSNGRKRDRRVSSVTADHDPHKETP